MANSPRKYSYIFPNESPSRSSGMVENVFKILQQARVEYLIRLRQHARELRVALLDCPHRLVDGLPQRQLSAPALGKFKEGVVARPRWQEQHARRVVGVWIVDARPAPPGRRPRQLRLPRREARVREAQENEAEHGRRVLGRLEPAVGAEIIGALPEALFQGDAADVFGGGCNPLHGHLGATRGPRRHHCIRIDRSNRCGVTIGLDGPIT